MQTLSFIQATDVLRAGKCVQHHDQALPWCYMKLVGEQIVWFGFRDTWEETIPYRGYADDKYVEVDEQTCRALKPAGTHKCGRRAESWMGASKVERPDFYAQGRNRKTPTCSYCGSMSGDEFMAGLEAGTLQVGPTDKSYKVYVRDAYNGTDKGKFYYQHLSAEQQTRFIELYNEKRLKLGWPGHLYRLPYFCQREPATTSPSV